MKKPEYMIENSRKLRKEMTKEELHLWLDFFKKCPFSVRRQKVMGRYILDFYIPEARIAVELDGRQHGRAEDLAADRERDRFLSECGITVLRYSNARINENFSGVCKDIQKHYFEKVESFRRIHPEKC